MAVLVPLFGVPGSWKRSAAGVGVAAAIAVGTTGVGLIAAPASIADEPEPVSCSVERTAADGVSAMLTAKLSGCRIEDLSQRTETSSTFARPDGDWDVTYAMSPVWVRTGGDGTSAEDWAALDADLRSGAEGGFAPVAHPAGIWVSGAQTAGQDGVSVVASLADPTTQATSEVTWPGDLPAPEVTGPRARYIDVEPGVDMVVDVTGAGIEQYFVLHDIPADASQVELPVGVQSQDATVVDTSADAEAAGLADLVAAEGEQDETVVARIGNPLAWDATYDNQLAHPVLADYNPADEAPLWAGTISELEAADAAPEAEEPGLLEQMGAAVAEAVGAEPEPVDLGEVAEAPAQVDVAPSGESADITLGLSDDFAQAAAAGPVVVDPSVSLALPWDTYVQSDSSVDKSTETELRLGTFDGGTTKARTFMNVDTSKIIGKSVRSATLKMWEHHSYSCTPAQWQAWSANPVPGAITWATQPTINNQYGTSTETKGHSAPCADGWVTMDLTSLARAWTNNTQTERGMALRAASETDSYGWKRFNSTNASTGKPTITVTLNTAPSLPSSASMTSGHFNWYPSSTATDRQLFVKVTKPQISAVVSDPDGDSVRLGLDILEGSALVWDSKPGAYVASGGRSVFAPTSNTEPLVHGHTYSARARANDGLLISADKALWTFAVDTAKPATPAVTASGYTAGEWKDTKPSSNTFTFTDSSTDVVRFEYSLDGGTWISVAATGTTSKTATLTWNPANGAHTLKVRAIDKAAWASADKTFTFGAGGASITAPTSAGLKSTSTVPVKATAPAPASGSVSAQVLWRVGGGAEPADFSATNGSRTGWTAIEGTVPVTTSGSTVTVSSTLDAAGIATELERERKATMLNVQVCFTYTSPATTRCSWTGTAKSHATATYVPHAFGDDFPTAEAGPGQVALWTGEFAVHDSDFENADLAIGRSFATYDEPGSRSGVFGSGWSASFVGDLAGTSSMAVSDNTTFDGTVSFTDRYDVPMVYKQPGTARAERKPGVYVAADDATAELGVRVEVSEPDAEGHGTHLTWTEGDGTQTDWSWSDGSWRAVSVKGVDHPGTMRFDYDGNGRLTRMLAPVPETDGAPISCNAGAEQRGCRVLSIEYGTTNSGTDATPGDRVGQVKQVSYTAWNAATSAMKTTVVSKYVYNGTGLLVKVTDPRSNLATSYTYSGTSSAGVPLLTGVTPAGLSGWTFQYGSTTQDSNALLTVTRDGPTTGAASIRTNRYVYGINPATATAGLPGMTAADTAIWGQETAPVYGAAVFDQDKAADVPGSAPGSVTAAMWPFADVVYTDAEGRPINTAAYGAAAWQVTHAKYDDAGRVVRALDAEAIDQIRADTAAGDDVDPNLYATLTEYNQEITSTADATGPADDEHPEGTTVPPGTVLIPEGTVVADMWYPATEITDPVTGDITLARAHVHTSYDQGAPNNGVNPTTGLGYALPTINTLLSEPVGAENANSLVLSESRKGYDPIDGTDPLGDSSGWVLGEPTTTTTETGATDIVTRVKFNGQGQEVERRLPKSAGADAGTTLTGYYTAAAQTGTFAACGGKPEWDGLACQTRPAETAPTVPVTTNEYGYLYDVTKTIESKAGATRTTAQKYLADGRVDTATVTTTGLATSATVPTTMTVYDNTTGLATATVSLNGAGTETERISTGYDKWGRQVSYTDTDGQTTTSAYDNAGNLATVTDPVGVTTYTTDSATEHRGLVTGVNLDGKGQINATYDAAGQVVSQEMPGQVTQTRTYDQVGQLSGMSYTTTDSGGEALTLGAWSLRRDLLGRVLTQDTNLGTGADGAQGRSLQYGYDKALRLTGVSDTLGGCTTTRAYGFDLNGNRTSQNTVVPTLDAGTEQCTQTTTTTAKTWTHDAAGRITNGATIGGIIGQAYTYDQLGRQTLIPAVDTPAGASGGDIQLDYYDTDAAHTVTQNGTTTTFALDPAGRRATETREGTGDITTIERHYGDGSDNPAWATETDGAVETTTWYGGSTTGDLAVTITNDQDTDLVLTDPHGDTALTLPVVTGTERVATAAPTYDEYGNAITAAATGSGEPLGYGWLGAHERAATDTGLTLMGARLYNPTTGQFTSVDPVVGGNTTAYTYPQDPVSQTDLSGMMSGTEILRHVGELWACISLGGRNCVIVVQISATAIWAVRNISTRYGKQNAIRHFLWSSMLTMAFGARKAKGITDSHEWREMGNDSRVDQYNNWWGRVVASLYQTSVRSWWVRNYYPTRIYWTNVMIRLANWYWPRGYLAGK
ncbi:RHS repeat-associated protein [Promicromonospora sp. AC04]|uniref:DNRLRE domain-containing protein n=1 Tax=Promicromonospora sp. AC04 TaxID=2135723 RepID=UPI000D4B70D1|nr:DNRLRE domain-containing protein [Promicromonospora sp. AC04]PUB20197.1 RHS repeat-associated protein [Promicromonospora sp. AC04]